MIDKRNDPSVKNEGKTMKKLLITLLLTGNIQISCKSTTHLAHTLNGVKALSPLQILHKKIHEVLTTSTDSEEKEVSEEEKNEATSTPAIYQDYTKKEPQENLEDRFKSTPAGAAATIRVEQACKNMYTEAKEAIERSLFPPQPQGNPEPARESFLERFERREAEMAAAQQHIAAEAIRQHNERLAEEVRKKKYEKHKAQQKLIDTDGVRVFIPVAEDVQRELELMNAALSGRRLLYGQVDKEIPENPTEQ